MGGLLHWYLILLYYIYTKNMKQQFHYATVSEAVAALKQQGYLLDLELSGHRLLASGQDFDAGDFEITDLYRYEGASDPADEAVVYALVSGSGLKGVLVTGYGSTVEPAAAAALERLHYKYRQGSV